MIKSSLFVEILMYVTLSSSAILHTATEANVDNARTRTRQTLPTKKIVKTTLTPTNGWVGSECHLCSKSQLQNNVNDTHNKAVTFKCAFLEYVKAQVNSSSKLNNSIDMADKKFTVLSVPLRDLSKYSQYRTLVRVVPFITDIPGLITNTLIVITAVKINRVQPSEIFMLTLGYAGFVAVSFRFTFKMFELYVNTMSLFGCKIIIYFLTVAKVFSNLILMSWSVERLLALTFPIELVSWRSIRNTKKISGLLLLLCICVSIPYITETDAVHDKNSLIDVCTFSKFITVIWVHIESVYSLYLPMVIMCICNATIVYRLRSMPSRIVMATFDDTVVKQFKENREKAILLLSVSGTFLILHIPYVIVIAKGYMFSKETISLPENPQVNAKYNIILLTYISHGITELQDSMNFFLFCIFRTKFRSTFHQLFFNHIASRPVRIRHVSRTQATMV